MSLEHLLLSWYPSQPEPLNAGKVPCAAGTAVQLGFESSSLLLTRLGLSGTQVYEPEVRALLGSASHFCEEVVLELRRLLTVWLMIVQAGRHQYSLSAFVDGCADWASPLSDGERDAKQLF